MKDMGFALMAAGALLTGLVGALFYNYFQQVLSASSSAASGSSTSLASTLGIYNSTANMPIYMTLAIFGFAFLITGGVFFALGNVSAYCWNNLRLHALLVRKQMPPDLRGLV